MCLSAEVSFGAAALLIPTGALSIHRAFKTDQRYLPIAMLPMLFGLQQLTEGIVWIAGAQNNIALITQASLVYMFFSWLAWPVWIPVSTYFLEPARRKPLYLGFVILGAMLGGLQYFPYFAHQGWLETKYLDHLIVYQGKELLDFVAGREITYLIYVTVVIVPLLLSSVRDVRIFGVLAALVLAVTFIFFSYAYVSVFCFGGALMSAYLVWMIFRGHERPTLVANPVHQKS
ncbi:DUF6629 family protein [Parasphingorhabdus sp.]|uniref:DUF6629 family protein n=1 Tax=Parasphingorhabdus sp. TaxID=2709688 RepID=UPI002F934BDB